MQFVLDIAYNQFYQLIFKKNLNFNVLNLKINKIFQAKNIYISLFMKFLSLLSFKNFKIDIQFKKQKSKNLQKSSCQKQDFCVKWKGEIW